MKSMLPSLPLLHVLAGMLQSMTTDHQCVGCFLAAFFCLVGCWEISSGSCTTKNMISPTTLHLFQGIIVEHTIWREVGGKCWLTHESPSILDARIPNDPHGGVIT